MTRLVNLATVAGAAITAASMIFGVMTYRRGVEVQHEAAAIGILQEFLKLSIEHPQLASGAAEQAEDPQYAWFATHALFTAETLWSLKGRDRQWESTILFVLRPHRHYLERGALPCDAYKPRIRGIHEERVPDAQVQSVIRTASPWPGSSRVFPRTSGSSPWKTGPCE